MWPNAGQIIKWRCIKAEINFIRKQRATDLILRKFPTLWKEDVSKLPQWMLNMSGFALQKPRHLRSDRDLLELFVNLLSVA